MPFETKFVIGLIILGVIWFMWPLSELDQMRADIRASSTPTCDFISEEYNRLLDRDDAKLPRNLMRAYSKCEDAGLTWD